MEEAIADQLRANGIDPRYESETIRYTKPETNHRYKPDFPLGRFIVETKGRFLAADRKKHVLIKEQHPDLDIRFVFSNSRARLSKVSKTTYADWCTKHGFRYADKEIPKEWIKELQQ